MGTGQYRISCHGAHFLRAASLRPRSEPVQDCAPPSSTSAVSRFPDNHLPARAPRLARFGCGSLTTLDARRALRLKPFWRVAGTPGPYRHGLSSAAGRGKKGAGMLEGAACGPSRKLLTPAAAGAGRRRCPRSPPTPVSSQPGIGGKRDTCMAGAKLKCAKQTQRMDAP